MRPRIISTFALVVGSVTTGVALGQCPSWRDDDDKTNEILLIFPPSYAPGPVQAWDGNTYTKVVPFAVADLVLETAATEDEMIASIANAMRDDYCEFDVKVSSMETIYSTSLQMPHRQIVAITSGEDPEEDPGMMDPTYELYGLSGCAEPPSVTCPDVASKDERFARVWAAGCEWHCNESGLTGLSGPNSTVERWTNCIAGTASHEAGHIFGLYHEDAFYPKAGEDYYDDLMASGAPPGCTMAGCPLLCEKRASTNRRFNDKSYEVLATYVGLCEQTLSNWDFINPNSEEAHSLEVEVLSLAKPVRSDYYNGSLSPWTDPQVLDPDPLDPKRTVGGVEYDIYRVRWSTPKGWDNGMDGKVPGDTPFHVGIAFSSTTPFLVGKARLFNTTMSPPKLPLAPRMLGYDKGPAPADASSFMVTFTNTDPDSESLCIEGLTVRFLPRLAAIDSMVIELEDTPLTRDGSLITIHGPALSFPDDPMIPKCLSFGESISFPIRSMSDPRFLDVPATEGFPGDAGEGSPQVTYTPRGRVVGLFPSTYVYVTATIVDAETELESNLFFQFAGSRPDCNRNDVDDFLDIASDASLDMDEDGVLDECERPFHRGDPNSTGATDISDGVYILNYLFLGGAAPACLESADSNNDGMVDISDAAYLLNWLFLGGPPPAAPGPPPMPCGLDPDGPWSERHLGCESYDQCP